LGTVENVGYFSVAMQMGDMMSLIPATVSLLLFPKLVRARADRHVILMKNLIGVVAIMVAGCLLAGALAPYLIPWLMGEPFRPAVPMFIWLLPGILFLSVITVLSQYLAALGFPWALPCVWFAGVVVLITGGIPLIKQYGATGASISISLAYFVVVVGISILCLSRRFTVNGKEIGT
jgi:O-antigen/teichoic acid export membrane protein